MSDSFLTLDTNHPRGPLDVGYDQTNNSHHINIQRVNGVGDFLIIIQR